MVAEGRCEMKAGVAVPLLALSVFLMGAAPEVPPYAARLEGFAGARIKSDRSSNNDYAFTTGGTGSAAANFGAGYLQADAFGDWTNNLGDGPTADFANRGVGGHLGIGSQDTGLIGINGAWQYGTSDGSPDLKSFWHMGIEGELFLDQFTLGTKAGYATDDVDDNNGYFVHALFRYYFTDDLKLEGTGGVMDSEDFDAAPLGAATLEYKVADMPLSVFTRWEGTFFDQEDDQTAVVGARLYFAGDGATLKRVDRAQLRDACNFGNISHLRGC
jgi:hypothetical protein